MNRRIQALAEQQGMTGPNFLISSHELEKFAQLIIFECVKLAVFKGDLTTGRAIKEHFGVEQNE